MFKVKGSNVQLVLVCLDSHLISTDLQEDQQMNIKYLRHEMKRQLQSYSEPIKIQELP